MPIAMSVGEGGPLTDAPHACTEVHSDVTNTISFGGLSVLGSSLWKQGGSGGSLQKVFLIAEHGY
jgi:hypothetical protein